MDILWRIFPVVTEPVPYTFVSVNRWNNEAWALICGLALHYSVDLWIQTYTEPVPLKHRKTACPQNISEFTDIITVHPSVTQSRLWPQPSYSWVRKMPHSLQSVSV